jgi:hypothetical protein
MSVIDVKILEESNPIIGVCQLTCTVDKDRNFHISKAYQWLMPSLVNIAGKLIPTSHFPVISEIVGETTNQGVLNSRAPVVVSNTEICVLICLSLTDINA